MNKQEWEKVKEVFAEIVDLPHDELQKYLDEKCGTDRILRNEVQSLLHAHQGTRHFIEDQRFAATNFLDSDNYVGRMFGNYEILREIGRGGMGAVFLARRSDGEFEQQVALKIIRQTFDDAEMERRFRRERQILASLNHPNIAQLHDGGVTAVGEPFLVMEYVEGEPIDKFCDRNNLSTHERLELFFSACRAVSFAHQNLVVHRDLKPSNILVTPDGIPKLLDFGIAKLLDDDHADEQTQTQYRAFTREYASPEQIAGEKITTASDVYSLGVLLSKLVNPESSSVATKNGFLPRGSTPMGKTYFEVSATKPQSTQTVNRRSKTELHAIIEMARREEPERRFASVQQLADDLQRYLDGLPVRAQKDSFRYRAGKFVQRNKIPVFAAVLIVLSFVVGLAAALWQTDAARRQRDAANAERLKATRINEFLQQMLSFSNQSGYSVSPVTQIKNVTVNEMLDDIAPRVEAELADQPEVRSQVLRTIGSAYASQGVYDKAEKNYRSALETQIQIFGTDHAETAATMIQFGILLQRQAKLAESDQLSQTAVAFYRRQQARQDPEFRASNLVTAINFLGATKYLSGDVQLGAELLEEALEVGRNADLQGHERFILAAVQGDLGLVLVRRGEIERGEQLLRESLAIHRQLSEYPRWEMGATLTSLGELYNRKHQPEQALEFLLESERIYRQTIGDRNRYLAVNLQHQAVTLSLQKHFAAAEPKAREQLAIYLEVVPGNTIVAALPRSVLGIVLVGNKRFDEAEGYLREGLQGLEQSPVKNHFIGVQAKIALSQCLLHKYRFADAEQFALAAHAEALQNLGEQSPFVEMAAESLSKIYEKQGKSR